MYAKNLVCTECKKTFPIKPLYECDNCNGILEVIYEDERIILESENPNPFIHYNPVKSENKITLGEGSTSLVEAKKLAGRLGLKKLLLKNEFINPTGSFKDRPVSIGISMAVQFGYKKVIVASSGNGATAVSAYAARAGLEAYILIPESTPDEKVKQSLAYGAKVIKVQGPYSNSFSLAKDVAEKFRMFNLTSTFINPYTVEGDKFIAYELAKQMDYEVPDVIYVPIGAGPLLVGVYKGFKELKRLNRLDKLPRMAGIQATGCNPISRAYLAGQGEVQPDQNPQTIAGAICDGLHGYAKDGTYTLKVINESKGFANDVTDEEIQEASMWLAQDEGLFVEPASAAAISGLEKSLKESKLEKNSTVVVLLTGHGLKDMKNLKMDYTAPVISNSREELIEIINNKKIFTKKGMESWAK